MAIEYSERVRQFMAENKALPVSTEDRHVTVRIYEERGALQLHLLIDQNASRQEIYDFLPIVMEWSNQLREYQPLRWRSDDRLYFYMRLVIWHNRGMSYQDIARKLNQMIADNLSTEYWAAHDEARKIMEYMGIEDPDYWIAVIRGDVAEGSLPAFEDGPIVRDMVVNRVRYWRKALGVKWAK